ncbi:hypothetical protein GCM10010371_66260 [Streptomyces subrutilus]|uniref:HTH cro/C1-type domain-containing protein n=1 Tax=Streptomyces subrutilus TaxID=36818 RepID=A0A5P2UK21_9ACTN|nr:helix-turn-helix domain-containing protein [Streptomyces subrutilus]QEU76927.1 hypothetical protein CP968_00025 [Streptomyces subrutilus]GGZ97143.1 hypothetical protein GCM10010371_66260 [Streptomyces subrutilus]
MGRPELPVDHTVPARGELAAALRGLRAAAGLTYDELAVRTGLSAATLKRAASGRYVPAWETVTAITEVCGDLHRDVGQLWQRARVAQRGRLKDLPRPASPELITNAGALSEALVYFYEWAGGLPLRRLQELAGEAYFLPVSTAARIVGRQALPVSRQQCIAFLTACGIGPRLVRRWADAYDRIIAARHTNTRASSSEVDPALVLLRDVQRLTERSGGHGSVRVTDLFQGPGEATRLRGQQTLTGLLPQELPQRRIRFAERPRRLPPQPA